jgi:hypothetical protein
MPHIASPKAKTLSEGAKKGMKIMTANQAMKAIIVGRQPNRSWVYALIRSPANWPTREELDKPDCHEGAISFCFDFSSKTPNRLWNCDWP